MLNHQNFSAISSALFLFSTGALSAEAPVCHRCEEIRLYNAEHHKNYEYFEDYLSDESGAKAQSVAEGKKTATQDASSPRKIVAETVKPTTGPKK